VRAFGAHTRRCGGLMLALAAGLGACRPSPPDGPQSATPSALAPRPVAPTAVALAADGTLWLGGIDGQIRAEHPDGQAEDRGTLHTGAVRRLSLENGTLRWSIASDTAARFAPDGGIESRFRLPGRHLNDARVLPDGDLLVAADRGDVARLGPDGAVRWRARGHHGRAAFAVDLRPPEPGQTEPTEAVSAGADGRVTRWRLADGEPLAEAHDDDGALLRVLWIGEHAYTLSARGRLTRWSAELRPEVQRETAVARVGAAVEPEDTGRAPPAATGLLADFERLYVATRGGHVRSYRLPDLMAGPVFSPPGSPAVFAPDAPTAAASGPAGSPATGPTPGPAPDPTIQAFDLRDDTLVVVHADGRIERHAVPRRRLNPVRRLPAEPTPTSAPATPTSAPAMPTSAPATPTSAPTTPTSAPTPPVLLAP
jgi:hypothetical protein